MTTLRSSRGREGSRAEKADGGSGDHIADVVSKDVHPSVHGQHHESEHQDVHLAQPGVHSTSQATSCRCVTRGEGQVGIVTLRVLQEPRHPEGQARHLGHMILHDKDRPAPSYKALQQVCHQSSINPTRAIQATDLKRSGIQHPQGKQHGRHGHQEVATAEQDVMLEFVLRDEQHGIQRGDSGYQRQAIARPWGLHSKHHQRYGAERVPR
mmetsp:Transcript_55648/g.129561  ORF Transcript_55648/g.129561 Transcript_55648/m.129561 type:complete len:210 (-) Transcript_55648:284-913(-)